MLAGLADIHKPLEQCMTNEAKVDMMRFLGLSEKSSFSVEFKELRANLKNVRTRGIDVEMTAFDAEIDVFPSVALQGETPVDNPPSFTTFVVHFREKFVQ